MANLSPLWFREKNHFYLMLIELKWFSDDDKEENRRIVETHYNKRNKNECINLIESVSKGQFVSPRRP